MDGFKYILEEESIRLADGLNAAGKGKVGMKAMSQISGHLE